VFSRLFRLAISMVYLAAVKVGELFLRVIGRAPKGTCVILYYHSVPADGRAAFARQMEMVRKHAIPIDIENPPAIESGKQYVGISFDDAFLDVLENAVPELVRQKIPAMIYVIANFLGRTADWWPEKAPQRLRKIATRDQLLSAMSENIRIGSHTLTHPFLTQLSFEAAKQEICDSKSVLESLFGRKVKSFSFPYGDCDDREARLCREAGYEWAFTSRHENAFRTEDAFLVGRVSLEPADWDLEFRVKILGGYAWRPWAVKVKRTLRSALKRRREPRMMSVPSSNK
jgi:peptidoglycan/xylan/chitin deacetylase (PgdA/CDA1 family)